MGKCQQKNYKVEWMFTRYKSLLCLLPNSFSCRATGSPQPSTGHLSSIDRPAVINCCVVALHKDIFAVVVVDADVAELEHLIIQFNLLVSTLLVK
jgi:hypothetical protein